MAKSDRWLSLLLIMMALLSLGGLMYPSTPVKSTATYFTTYTESTTYSRIVVQIFVTVTLATGMYFETSVPIPPSFMISYYYSVHTAFSILTFNAAYAAVGPFGLLATLTTVLVFAVGIGLLFRSRQKPKRK
jgi:hypothetical protein